MAENDTGEKTESPSGRRLNQARKEGTVARSTDLSQACSMIAAFITLQYVTPRFFQDMLIIMRGGFDSSAIRDSFNVEGLRLYFCKLLLIVLPDVLLLMVIVATVGGLSTAIQTNFLWTNKMFHPKWFNISPLAGFKRIFSMQNGINLVKSIAKLLVIGTIAYFAFLEIAPQLFSLMELPLNQIFPYAGSLVGIIFWRIMKLLIVIAILDYAWQRYSTTKTLKMTKVEVKEERKAVEGDEATKMRIRGKALQRVRQRIIAAIKTADVVVTNPTHFAVALQYTGEIGTAPRVVAKGQDYLAERIKKLAREHGVPVIERKPLARALYKAVDVGKEIPYELYTAVAELLAYVYKIKGRKPTFRKSQKKTHTRRKQEN